MALMRKKLPTTDEDRDLSSTAIRMHETMADMHSEMALNLSRDDISDEAKRAEHQRIAQEAQAKMKALEGGEP